MIDVKQQISDVRRAVGNRTLEAGEARVSTISQVYDTDIDDLWEVVTTPERISRWFLPVSGDLALGGRYQLEGNAGGTIERCDPPHGFAATWEYGGDVSWIEVRLSVEGERRTRFELDHVAHITDERWAEFGPGATGVGWDLALLGLRLYLAAGDAFDRQAAEAWSASPEGGEFMALSSARWCDASIAAGTDADQAQAAAGRTTAFYTGAP